MVQLEAEPFIAISLLLRGFFIMNSCAEGTEIQGSQVVLRHTTLSQSHTHKDNFIKQLPFSSRYCFYGLAK